MPFVGDTDSTTVVEEEVVTDKKPVAEEIAQELVEVFGDDALPQQNDINANEPQYLVLRTYTRVNTALARRVCQLSPAAEAAFSKMDDKWVAKQVALAADSPVKAAAAGVARFLQGLRIQNPQRNQPEDVIKRAKVAIDKHIDSILSPDQSAELKRERAARDDFRKQALAEVLVSVLDQRLFLTEKQRLDLTVAVRNWLTSDLYWMFYFQNQNYIPSFPTSVLRVLSDSQREALKNSNAWNYEFAQIELQMAMQEQQILIAE